MGPETSNALSVQTCQALTQQDTLPFHVAARLHVDVVNNCPELVFGHMDIEIDFFAERSSSAMKRNGAPCAAWSTGRDSPRNSL
jgi:hypothetical protein